MGFWDAFWTVVKILGIIGAAFTAYRLYLLAKVLWGRLKQLHQTYMVELPQRVEALEARVTELEAADAEHLESYRNLTRRTNAIGKKTDALDARTSPAAMLEQLGGRYHSLGQE